MALSLSIFLICVLRLLPGARADDLAPAPASKPISVGASWYWQLQGSIDMDVAATVYDLDLFDNSAERFATLKQSGRMVICYFSAGSYEDWRADASQFPKAALGKKVSGWPGERWVDIRNATVRRIMVARLELAKQKGCDGVEPDNVDGYSNDNGLGLTRQDQIDYLTFLADEAHARGLTIALKNATELVSTLVDDFDFAVVESCFEYDECRAYSPFIRQNKAVLSAEYSNFSTSLCSKAKKLKFSTVFYNLDLDGEVYNPCP